MCLCTFRKNKDFFYYFIPSKKEPFTLNLNCINRISFALGLVRKFKLFFIKHFIWPNQILLDRPLKKLQYLGRISASSEAL